MKKHLVENTDRKLLLSVLEEENWSDGKWCRTFEKQFANYIGTKYAIIMPNCTYSFKLVLRCLGIKKGDEIIVPAITWPSMIVAIMECNAIPVIVDIGVNFQMNPEQLLNKITNKTRAILATHLYGFYENIENIRKIVGNKSIFIIEDCAHTIGYKVKGKKLGSLGDVAVTSFNSKKMLSCGEGGCILTNNENIYSYLCEIREVDERVSKYGLLPSNYLVSEFQAAVLISQLENYEKLIEIEQKNALYVSNILSESNRIKVFSRQSEIETQTWYNYVFSVDFESTKFIEIVNSKIGNVLSMIYPPLIHSKVFCNIENNYRNLLRNWNEKDCPCALDLYKHCCRFHHSFLLMNIEDLNLILEAILGSLS